LALEILYDYSHREDMKFDVRVILQMQTEMKQTGQPVVQTTKYEILSKVVEWLWN